jgi:hypothetical protein
VGETAFTKIGDFVSLNHRPTGGIVRAVAAASTLAALICSVAALRPTWHRVAGLAFRVSASTRIYAGDNPQGTDDEIMRGRGVAAENHSRIEFLAFTPAPQGITTDDFLIALDSGKVFVEHPSSSQYTPADDMLGGPGVVALARIMGGRGGGGFPGGGRAGGARGNRGGGGGGRPGGRGGARGARGGRGRGGGASGLLEQMELLNVTFKLDKLGAGETIDNRPTQHYRITTDYRIVWADQGFPAHAVTEIWTTPLPTAIPNPFEPLVVADRSTDGPLIEYGLKLRAIRAQLEGTPIKVVTTTTLSDIRDVVGLSAYVGNDPADPNPKVTIMQQTQITSIAPADVDPKLFVVPDPNQGSPEQH